jgi:hypothetical protein
VDNIELDIVEGEAVNKKCPNNFEVHVNNYSQEIMIEVDGVVEEKGFVLEIWLSLLEHQHRRCDVWHTDRTVVLNYTSFLLYDTLYTLLAPTPSSFAVLPFLLENV